MVAKASVLHVRFDGRSVDVPLSELDIGLTSTDQQVRLATAQFLKVSSNALRDYVIDRHETRNMTIRPEAVFG